MNKTLRAVTLGLSLLSFSAGAAPAAAQTAPQATPAPTAEAFALTRGRMLMQEFLAARLNGLWNAFSPQVQAQWGTLAAFEAFREGGIREYGQEQQVVQERTITQGGETYYVRSATFEKAPNVVWALVIGFQGMRVTSFGIVLETDEEVTGEVAARPGGAL